MNKPRNGSWIFHVSSLVRKTFFLSQSFIWSMTLSNDQINQRLKRNRRAIFDMTNLIQRKLPEQSERFVEKPEVGRKKTKKQKQIIG